MSKQIEANPVEWTIRKRPDGDYDCKHVGRKQPYVVSAKAVDIAIRKSLGSAAPAGRPADLDAIERAAMNLAEGQRLATAG